MDTVQGRSEGIGPKVSKVASFATTDGEGAARRFKISVPKER